MPPFDLVYALIAFVGGFVGGAVVSYISGRFE